MPKLHSVSGQTINRPKNAKNPLNISAHVPKQGIYNKIWTFFFYEKKKMRFCCHSKSYLYLSTSSLLDVHVQERNCHLRFS